MRLDEARRDYFRKLAREKGYKSRAAFKLIEINERYNLIKRRDRVVDFGASPGGWTQVASSLVGDRGLVVAVDIVALNLRLRNVRYIKSDVNDPAMVEMVRQLIPAADVVLSDIAPQVSGAWEFDHYRQVELTLQVVELSDALLRKGGNAFLKIFEGERFKEMEKHLTERFDVVRVTKPKASRMGSSELYFACLGYRG